MKIDTNPSYDYKDVFIKPQFSKVTSRKNVFTSQELWGQMIDIPVISANMDTVTDWVLASKIVEAGGMAAIHRFMSVEQSVKEWNYFKTVCLNKQCFMSLGVNKETELDRLKQLVENGSRWFIIDVAHGASTLVEDMVKEISKFKKVYPDIRLVLGNFANQNSLTEFLYGKYYLDIDGFKIGIGPGSVCLTKNVTGVTTPQFSAVASCAETIEQASRVDGHKRLIIADGGIREYGDIGKAIGAGAHFVMTGRLFAECEDSIAGRTYSSSGEVLYRGMASPGAMQTLNRKDLPTPEGKEELIKSKTSSLKLLNEIKGALQSTMSYCNKPSLTLFRGQAEFGVKYNG